jgi:hypothetical protein
MEIAPTLSSARALGVLATAILLISQGCHSPSSPEMEAGGSPQATMSRAELAADEFTAFRREGSPTPASTSDLEFTFDSPEGLATSFLRALRARNAERLKRFALSEREFCDYVWPQLPRSRPEMGVPIEYAWGDLHQKSLTALAMTFRRYGGRSYELIDVRFRGETTDYGLFLVHRRAVVIARNELGRTVQLELFGSILEADGAFKLFSYVVD